MVRSRVARGGLFLALLLSAVTLVAACSSPTARPGGIGGESAAPAGDFGGPPGPANVPDTGQEGGYLGPSVERFPTAINPYPGPDESEAGTETDVDQGEAGADEQGSVEEGAAGEGTADATPGG